MIDKTGHDLCEHCEFVRSEQCAELNEVCVNKNSPYYMKIVNNEIITGCECYKRGKTISKSQKRRITLQKRGQLEDLIKNYEVGGCFSITSDQEIYELLKELQSLRSQNYESRLLTQKEVVIQGIERERKLVEQNKLLREDGERLAKYLYDILVHEYSSTDTANDPDGLIFQHKELIERIEKEI